VFIVFAVEITGKSSNLPIKNYKYTKFKLNGSRHVKADKYSKV